MSVRVVALAVYVVLRLLPPDVIDVDHSSVVTLCFFGLPVLAGLLVGRWWLVPLAGLLFVQLAIWGDGCAAEAARDPSIECDINWCALLLVVYVPLEVALLAAGATARRATAWLLTPTRSSRAACS